MSCRRLVFDTGPLSSFAVVARLDLLEASAGRPRLPGRSGPAEPPSAPGPASPGPAHQAGFLGVPEVLEHPADILEAELLRARLAGSSLSQRHNRGEAEAIFLARGRRGVFVSEDRDARVLAAAELGPGRVAGTTDLLARAVRMGLLRPLGARELPRAIWSPGRRPGPPDHRPCQPGRWTGEADGPGRMAD